MVLAQIGEHAHLEGHTVDPVLIEGVGGGLHHHMGTARLLHLGEEALDLKGLRGGAVCGENLLPDHILVGADEAHLGPQGLLQNEFQQVRRGGLAAGAGDCRHHHVVGGMAEEIAADHSQAPAGVRHLNIGDFLLRNPLTQHRRRALFPGLADEAVSVHCVARHGHKQVPRLGFPGVIADAGDLHFQIRCGGENVQSSQDFLQFHKMRPFIRNLLYFGISASL